MTIPVKNPFISAVRSSLKIVSSTNYTLTELDGYDTVLVTTGASDRTITLPAGTLSLGRRIKIRKQDSGAGKVILSSAASEQIDGYTLSGNGYYLTAQYALVEVVCDGTNWVVMDTQDDRISVDFNNPVVINAGVTGNLASILMPVGAWDIIVTSACENSPSGSVDQLSIHTVSATLSGDEGKSHTYQSKYGTGIGHLTCGPVRHGIPNTTTTIYATAQSTVGGVSNWYGRLQAFRVR